MVLTELFYVLAAAVVNFILGGVWYGLFQKQWLSSWNLKLENINKKDPTPYLVAFIGSVWASYGMFVLLKHVRPNGVVELLFVSIGTWLFVYVGLGAKHYAFARIKMKAFLIDYGLDLVGLIVMVFILNGI